MRPHRRARTITEGRGMANPYADVFERIEKKYRIAAEQRRHIERALEQHMRPDDRGLSLITSLYLDTPDRSLISRSTEKPLYKEKVRLRAYGRHDGERLMSRVAGLTYNPTPPQSRAHSIGAASDNDGDEVLVFLEVKKKFKGIVYKRRVGLTADAAQAYLNGASYEQAHAEHPIKNPELRQEALGPRDIQIAREADALLKRHGWPKPSMAIACERIAWTCAEGGDDEARPDLRITFDGQLTFCDVTRAKPRWRPVIAPDESIMEVKSAGAFPLWLTHALAECKAYSAPFSKYGTAYHLAGKE